MENGIPAKRFLIVSLTEISKEPRVSRQIRVLREFGEVHTIGFGEKPDGASSHQSLDRPDGLKIGRYKVTSIPVYALTVFSMILRIHRLTGLLLPGASSLKRKLSSSNFDVLVVRDLQPLVAVKESFGKVPVWIDLPEFTPRQNESSRSWRILFAPYYRWVATKILIKAQVTTTLGPRIAHEYSVKYQVNPRVIRNAARFIESSVPTKKIAEPIRLVHSGAAIRARRLEEMIEAIAGIGSRFCLDLYLIKTDSAYFEELRELAGRTQNCRILEPVEHSQLISVLSKYDVSLVVIPPTSFNYKNTLPNKLFDAIQARLAIVSGPTDEISDVVSEFKLGLISTGFDQKSLASAINQLTFESIYQYKLNSHNAAKFLGGESDDNLIREFVNGLI